MKKLVAGVLVVLLVACALSVDPREAASAPTPGAPLAVFQQCSTSIPGTARVTFIWTPADQGLQWLDLTTGDPGFPGGTYVSAGPLAAGTWSFVWDGIAPGAAHTARTMR